MADRDSATSSTASPWARSSGATYDLVDPATGEVYAAAAAVRGGGRRPGHMPPPTPPSRPGATPRPPSASSRCSIADAMEPRADEFIAAECRNTGKPLSHHDRGAAAAWDQLRFFAGAARVLEGRSAGEYLAGDTSWIRREPIGVVGQVTPWNYPLMMVVWKIAPALAAGNTVVLKPSDTTPASTVLLAELCRSSCRRVFQRRLRRPRHRPRAGRAPDPADGRDHRLGPRRDRGRRARPRPTQADPPRARRQGAGDRLRRRRSREGREGDRRRRLLQRRPGLHRRDPGAGRSGHPRRLRRRADRAGPQHQTGMPDDDDVVYGPLNNRTSSSASPACSTGCPTTRTSPTGGAPPGRPGLLLRPTCSPDSGRTTSRSSPRSSARSSPCSSSPTRPRRCAGPTASSTAWPPSSGPGTTAARCGCPRASTSGCAWINTHIPIVAEMPHGGFKHSGYGKDLSMYGLEDYTHIEHVTSNIGE